MINKLAGTFIILAAILVASSAQDSRQNPQAIKPKDQSTNTTCGTDDDLALRIQACARPLMDILEGKLEKWPKNEKETADLCNNFAAAEKCIKRESRRCATGLHKTILSTVANSVQRARKRECSKPRYPYVLKMTQCVEKHQDLVQLLVSNATDRLSVIKNQVKDLDQKMNGVCCMVNEIENSIKVLFLSKCKEETMTIIKLYRAVLEDVLELICLNPKCKDVFNGLKIPKNKTNQGIIYILLQIVFSLGV